VVIRPAVASDLAGIAAIYDPECERGLNTMMTRARTHEEWVAWLREHEHPRYPVLVATEGEGVGASVLGWASLSRWSEREGYARTAENSVYVHADAQGKGVGRALMLELLRSGEAQGVRLVIARINNGNEASVRFHESLGFQTIGVMPRCGQKFGRVIDVRIMGWQSTLE
jgi:phosphinothricin acetyltransferase